MPIAACAFSGRYFHLSGKPGCVRSSAYATFGYGVMTYIVLPTTSGCPSWPRNTPVEKVHETWRFFALAGVICERLLKRLVGWWRAGMLHSPSDTLAGGGVAIVAPLTVAFPA